MSLRANSETPIVWTIAGSDPCGGAGLQADLKTIAALGGHGCSIVSAVTAQNTQSFQTLIATESSVLQAQFESLRRDLFPRAVKVGLLSGRASIHFVADAIRKLRQLGEVSVVIDPIIAASAGPRFLDREEQALLIKEVFPIADVLTPNIPEAAELTGLTIDSSEDVEEAGRRLLESGIKCVIIKGGHASSQLSQDFICTPTQKIWLNSPRIDNTQARGTGCTFSAALATASAFGFDFFDSAVIAKTILNQSLRRRRALSSLAGAQLLDVQGWPGEAVDFPWSSHSSLAGQTRLKFPDCGATPLGFYPIVDRAQWLERLLPLGVNTIQLRCKDLHGDALEAEIRRAVRLAHEHSCRLFINDYWKLAIKHGAYGIHLGQEDFEEADLAAIARAGLRLGLSTHSYAELARAKSVEATYVALGPLYPTQIKKMRFAPQGLDTLCMWRKLTGQTPLVAIGGINLESLPEVQRGSPDGVAIVSDLVMNPDPERRARQWLKAMGAVPTAPAEQATLVRHVLDPLEL